MVGAGPVINTVVYKVLPSCPSPHAHNCHSAPQHARYYSHSDIEITCVQCEHKSTVYYIAPCYHPPRPQYSNDLLTRDLNILVNSRSSNRSAYRHSLDTEFLTTDLGISQLVHKPTFGNNTLDKFYTSCGFQRLHGK